MWFNLENAYFSVIHINFTCIIAFILAKDVLLIFFLVVWRRKQQLVISRLQSSFCHALSLSFLPNTQRRRININEMCILIELFFFLLTPLPQMPWRIKPNSNDWLIGITCMISIAFWLYKPSHGTKMSRSITTSSIGKSDFLFSIIVLINNYSWMK